MLRPIAFRPTIPLSAQLLKRSLKFSAPRQRSSEWVARFRSLQRFATFSASIPFSSHSALPMKTFTRLTSSIASNDSGSACERGPSCGGDLQCHSSFLSASVRPDLFRNVALAPHVVRSSDTHAFFVFRGKIMRLYLNDYEVPCAESSQVFL